MSADQSYELLSQAIEGERGEGVVHVSRQERLAEMSITTELDALARELGFAGLGPRWIEVGVDEAIQIAATLLHRDMAYGAEIMPWERAEELARAFVELFGPGLRCFTNGSWSPDPARGRMLGGCSPLTGATFDSGVVVVGQEHVGLLWFEDEED